MKAAIGNVKILPFEEGSQDADRAGLLFANLNTRSSSTGALSIMDGVVIVLHNTYAAALTDKNDIRKVNSITGNMALSLSRNGEIMMVEAHPHPAAEAVFALETRGLPIRGYAFTFNVKNLNADGREIFLKDNFLLTLTPINGNSMSMYNFDVTIDKASAKSDRFEIVFKQNTVLPVTFTHIAAHELYGDVKVNWRVATEEKMSHYEVEHSRNGIDFGKAIKFNARNESPASYEWLHVQPGIGDHFYRVRAINSEARSITTRIVKVNIGSNENPAFKVFPTNITKTSAVTVQLTNMEKGSYMLQVSDMAGRIISSQEIEHAGGSAALILSFPTSISKGKYIIRLEGKSGVFAASVLRH
jgi:hypothetical protein